mmetsp:Transcript_36597/g.97583  ORF Transcript_36597/g.97583 Transcript_36597/m.97583 type:complete len:309 (+) Transcript_36597:1310-2236(+)
MRQDEVRETLWDQSPLKAARSVIVVVIVMLRKKLIVQPRRKQIVWPQIGLRRTVLPWRRLLQNVQPLRGLLQKRLLWRGQRLRKRRRKPRRRPNGPQQTVPWQIAERKNASCRENVPRKSGTETTAMATETRTVMTSGIRRTKMERTGKEVGTGGRTTIGTGETQAVAGAIAIGGTTDAEAMTGLGVADETGIVVPLLLRLARGSSAATMTRGGTMTSQDAQTSHEMAGVDRRRLQGVKTAIEIARGAWRHDLAMIVCATASEVGTTIDNPTEETTGYVTIGEERSIRTRTAKGETKRLWRRGQTASP